MSGRTRSADDRLFALVLERWSEWLLSEVMPSSSVAANAPGGASVGPDEVYAYVQRVARSNTEHSDRPLAGLLNE